eukprot:12877427-Ditylum_brightwellii.AAC.1
MSGGLKQDIQTRGMWLAHGGRPTLSPFQGEVLVCGGGDGKKQDHELCWWSMGEAPNYCHGAKL